MPINIIYASHKFDFISFCSLARPFTHNYNVCRESSKRAASLLLYAESCAELSDMKMTVEYHEITRRARGEARKRSRLTGLGTYTHTHTSTHKLFSLAIITSIKRLAACVNHRRQCHPSRIIVVYISRERREGRVSCVASSETTGTAQIKSIICIFNQHSYPALIFFAQFSVFLPALPLMCI
jgi:hypothetical protein